MKRLLSTRELVAGHAVTSPLLRTSVGLSFWGGVDPTSSLVVDRTHPLHGETLRDKILAVPNGRGSCTGSQVILELILNGIAPRAMVLRQPDLILALGALVAEEMFDVSIPIVSIGEHRFDELLSVGDDRSELFAAVNGDTVLYGPSELDVRIALDESCPRRSLQPAPLELSLTDEELNMCSGTDATAIAMRILTRAATIDGATSLLPISQAHIDGCTYIGPGGLRFAQRLAEMGGHVRVPTTLNSNSVDRRRWQSLGVPPSLGAPAHALGDAYVQMGCSDRSFTCAPYLLSTRPEYEDRIAWGESNAVVFANSVIGARTEKLADYLDICCAITGRVPLSGMHLDENRAGRVVLDVSELASSLTVEREDNEDAIIPLIGYLCGMRSESKVPVVVGFENAVVTSDDLKAFCAAFGSTASAPMFHMVGHTPEAPDLVTALGGVDATVVDRVVLDRTDAESAWGYLNDDVVAGDDNSIQLVAIGNPHLSLTECRDLAELCVDSHVADGVKIIVTMGREVYAQAEREGYVDRLRQFGMTFINDTCWCMLTEPIIPTDGTTLVTNSAKYAHYAPGLVNKKVRFHGLAGCVEAAKTGYSPKPPRWMLRWFVSESPGTEQVASVAEKGRSPRNGGSV